MNKRSWSLLGNLISSSDIFVLKVPDWQEWLLSLVTVEMRWYQFGESYACPSLSRGSKWLLVSWSREIKGDWALFTTPSWPTYVRPRPPENGRPVFYFQTHYWTPCNNDSYKTIIITEWITKHFACFNSA